MAVEMEQCRGGGILANSSHGLQVSPASVVGVTTAAQLKMQKIACSGGASPCPQSVSPLLPPTPPGSRSPPSSRLSPSPHQQQNNTQPQLQQQQQQQHEPRPQQQQQRILPFSIDNILKPDFGNSKSDYGRLHSSRSPEPPELLLRTPPKTPEVPSRHDSPVDLSHKANSIINNGISASLGLNGGNKTNNGILLSHSINLLIGPHSHPLHPLQHHLQQTLLQQQHQQIQHVSQPHLQHPIITKPIPLSTSTAFQIFKPLSNFAEQQRRLQQQHHLEQQQHHLQQQQQQQQQHQLRITSPHLKPPVPHQDHLNSNTQSQQSVTKHKVLHQHQKEHHQQPFKEQPQQSPIQHQTILHQNTKTPLPAPSPTPSTCSTTSSCSSTTSTSGSTKNSSLSPNNSSSSKSGNSKPGSDSLEELVNPKIPEDNSNWPAWVYCTRYSDRPSSGPRSRRVKRHDRNPEEKRPRTAFTSDQLNRLKKEFEDNKYLTEKRRQDLARELGLNESQIKIWFQNKRAKIKKNSGPRSGLAQHLMAQGLYNHCTVPVDEDDPYLS